jgi:hypothetical protein
MAASETAVVLVTASLSELLVAALVVVVFSVLGAVGLLDD